MLGVGKFLSVDHCHLVLRPASCVFAGPKSEVLAIFAVSLFHTALHQEVTVASSSRAGLRTADFSRQGGDVVRSNVA